MFGFTQTTSPFDTKRFIPPRASTACRVSRRAASAIAAGSTGDALAWQMAMLGSGAASPAVAADASGVPPQSSRKCLRVHSVIEAPSLESTAPRPRPRTSL